MTFREVVEELILHIFWLLVAPRVFIPEGKKCILLGASKAFLAPFPDEQREEKGHKQEAEKDREQKDAHECDYLLVQWGARQRKTSPVRCDNSIKGA